MPETFTYTPRRGEEPVEARTELPTGTKLQCPICNTLYLKGERHACGEPPHKIDLSRDALLVERQKTYGSFAEQGAFAHGLKMTFRSVGNYPALRNDQREALDMIATKISRLLHGSPKVKDTWDDIAGYAKLGSEACDG